VGKAKKKRSTPLAFAPALAAYFARQGETQAWVEKAADKAIRPASRAQPTVDDRRRLNPSQRVAREMFPPRGFPPLTIGTPEAVQKLADEMTRRGLKVRSYDTLKRALGRRGKRIS
jgi:hypothetical protein